MRRGFGSRLRIAMSGRKIAEISKAIGVSEASFYKWLEGRFEPGLAKLAALASIGNVTLDWLITGAGRMRPDDQPGYVVPSWPGQRAPVLFERDWFEKNIGLFVDELKKVLAAQQPEQFADSHLFEVPDDSMEPTLKKADLVLGWGVAGNAPSNGIFLVWFRDRAATDQEIAASLESRGLPQRIFPRRIEWSEDSFLVKCDNPAYPEPIRVTEKEMLRTIVMWRVVWHGRLI